MRFGNNMDTFKSFIKKTREKLNLTQQGFAEKVGVTKGTVYIWEQGNNMPNISDIELLKELSKVSNTPIPEIRRKMVAQANLNDDNDDCEDICKSRKYTFLPEDIIDFSLSKEEVNILNLMTLARTTEKNLEIRDYIKLSDNIQSTIKNYNSLQEKFELIPFEILSEIVQKNDMDSLYIQNLAGKDIVKILENKVSSKNLFNIMREIKNKKQILFCGHNNLQGLALLNYSEVSSYIEKDSGRTKGKVFSKSEKTGYYNGYYYNYKVSELFMEENTIYKKISTGEKYSLKEDISDYEECKCNYQLMGLGSKERIYFSLYIDSINEAKERYNKEKGFYDESRNEWSKKMEKIKEWQELYNDKEKYPDLPEPKAPTIPQKYRMITISKKGEALYDFLKDYYLEEESVDNKTTDNKDSNYRDKFEQYLEKEINVSGLLSEICDGALLIRDLYVGEQYVSDHLWLYDCKISECDLKPGQRYNITGIVKKYTKKDGKTNLGITVSNIEEDASWLIRKLCV